MASPNRLNLLPSIYHQASLPFTFLLC